MADLGFGPSGYDSSAKENNQSNVIPKGDYPALIVKSDKVPTKDGTGFRLTLQFQILQGEFKNKIIFEGLNLWLAEIDDKKREAVKIAKGQFSELCRAVNVLTPTASEQLHNIPLILKVGVQEADGSFPSRNVVRGYKAGGRTQAAPTTAPQAPAVAPSAPASGNPW